MAKKWQQLRSRMSDEAQARSKAFANGMMLEIEALNLLRSALDLTQGQVAELLQSSQPNVSKLEQQGDMHISTLRRYIEALGGRLKIVAEVKGKDYMLAQFDK